MASKGKLFSWCGVCCPKRNNFCLVLTTVVLWSLVAFAFFIFFLQPSELPTTESIYDVARIQSEILRKSALTGMNIKLWYITAYFKTRSGHQTTTHRWHILSLNTVGQFSGEVVSTARNKGFLVLRVTRQNFVALKS